MNRNQLYDKIADRKIKPADFNPYDGNNGRVNRCVALMKSDRIKTGGVLLDVGGGIGDLCFASKDMFEKTICMDISSTNLEAAQKKTDQTICCDVDTLGLFGVEDESIDLITALDFIEHIIDPENFAKECYRVLKPSGMIFLNTPNIQYHEHLTQLIRGINFPQTSGDKEVWGGGHVSFFTFYDLLNIFGRAGLTGFGQFKDDEGYSNPPDWLQEMNFCQTREEYVEFCMRFGNPNILFTCIKDN